MAFSNSPIRRKFFWFCSKSTFYLSLLIFDFFEFFCYDSSTRNTTLDFFLFSVLYDLVVLGFSISRLFIISSFIISSYVDLMAEGEAIELALDFFLS